MFSRRRSRAHYDPKQYNSGISTPSASTSAAANAFYMKKLGPSAAAEALRRHSLDQSGANAMRDFELDEHQPAAQRQVPQPRRANSMTSRSYQVVHNNPHQHHHYTPPSFGQQPRYSSPTTNRSRTSSFNYSPSLSGGPPRRNSLSSDRSNSLSRTHTTVNRDSSGRTMSLTTTTIRQMGSFELVSTKEVPISSPNSRLSRPSFTDFGSRTNSLKSMDSELMGIQEEPEEDSITLARRLNRLGDPLDIPEEEDEEEIEQPKKAPLQKVEDDDADVDAEDVDAEDEDSLHFSEEVSDATVSDATASPGSLKASAAGATDLEAPASSNFEPQHREVSPARSALRNNSGQNVKTKVSFGGADEPYVYESYEHDEEEDEKPATSPGIAAATAAARSRQQQQLQNYSQLSGSALSGSTAAAAGAQGRRRIVMSQPPLNVEKRPSQTSLNGRTPAPSSARRAAAAKQQAQQAQQQAQQAAQQQAAQQQAAQAAQQQQQSAAQNTTANVNTPYPHARPWDRSNEDFVDAPSSLEEVPVPARSVARLKGTRSAGSAGSSKFIPDQETQQPQTHEPEVDPIRAQALALAQTTFNIQQQKQQHSPTKNDKAPNGSHLYRSLLDDDAASIRSDSSFTRERKRGGAGGAGAGGAGRSMGRMRSLRQPATPTLRNNNTSNKKGGRTMSLLNQNHPDVNIGSYASAAPSNPPPSATVGGGFRTFSLRNTQRPEPSQLLGGTGGGLSGAGGSGGGLSGLGGGGDKFRSRITDSDSEDEGGHRFGGKSKRKNNNGKVSLFSPNMDVKDLFKQRAASDGVVDFQPPKAKKKTGFFKRVFGRKEVID